MIRSFLGCERESLSYAAVFIFRAERLFEFKSELVYTVEVKRAGDRLTIFHFYTFADAKKNETFLLD